MVVRGRVWKCWRRGGRPQSREEAGGEGRKGGCSALVRVMIRERKNEEEGRGRESPLLLERAKGRVRTLAKRVTRRRVSPRGREVSRARCRRWGSW